MLFATVQEEHSAAGPVAAQEGTGSPSRERKSRLRLERGREAAGAEGRGEGMAAGEYGKGRVTCNKGGKGFKQRG